MTDRSRRIAAEALRGILGAIVAGIAVHFLAGFVDSFSEQSWRLAVVALPLAAAVLILGRPLWRQRRLVLGGGYLAFLLVYCVLFSVLAASELLDGKRTILAGYEEATPRNFLGLGWMGDWRYWLAPPAPRAHDLLIVSLPSFEGVKPHDARRLHAGLIDSAVKKGARGIAFDFYLRGQSVADGILCFYVDKAAEAGVPVFFGYRLAERNGNVVRDTVPSSLRGCLSDERLASLAGYRESDGRIRSVPLFVRGDERLGTLSYKVARAMAGEGLDLPADHLLQFLAPAEGVTTIEGVPEGDELDLYRDRFVLVGSYRPRDRHETPFGTLSGVEIHAYATNSLATGHFIRRLGRTWIFPIIFLLCGVLGVVQASGGGRKALLGGAFLLSVAVVGGAALAMWLGRLWIDVSYPLVAMGGLTILLWGGSELEAGRRRAGLGRARSPGEGRVDPAVGMDRFDVFLSHNGEDKPAVRELADILVARGLRPWLDERELPPGRPWIDELERVIDTVASAAVLVGQNGLGPWEKEEARACLQECVERHIPVIPVLLPEAPGGEPDLPMFIKLRTWVDLRNGFTERDVDRLVWGITGRKPPRKSRH